MLIDKGKLLSFIHHSKANLKQGKLKGAYIRGVGLKPDGIFGLQLEGRI